MTGEIVFIIYVIGILIIGVCGIDYEPKKNKFNFNWVFTLFIILFIISPLIAKFCGLYN